MLNYTIYLVLWTFLFVTWLFTNDNSTIYFMMSSMAGGSGKSNQALMLEAQNTELADPETTPWMMPYSLYSALMGLIINDGVRFDGSAVPAWFPDDWRLRFSHKDPVVLEYLTNYFADWFRYGDLTNNKTRRYTYSGWLSTHLHAVWTVDNKVVMPNHFEVHFNWSTLAFWAMRNGFTHGNLLRIGVSTLSQPEKLRLVKVLQDKLGLESYLTGPNSPYLFIKGINTFRDKLLPFFHPSLVHRITNIPRTQRPGRTTK